MNENQTTVRMFILLKGLITEFFNSIIVFHISFGASMNYKQGGGRGLPKCQRYYMYISLYSKLVNERGGCQKFCQRSL